MALKPNGIPKKGSLDDAMEQVSRMKGNTSPSVPYDSRSNLDYHDAAELPKSARGRPGYDARVPSPPKNKPKSAPAIVDKPKPSRPASSRPSVAPTAQQTAAKPKPTPATAPKRSWWDKFSDNHKLSADKSYADYKRLMGDN